MVVTAECSKVNRITMLLIVCKYTYVCGYTVTQSENETSGSERSYSMGATTYTTSTTVIMARHNNVYLIPSLPTVLPVVMRM